MSESIKQELLRLALTKGNPTPYDEIVCWKCPHPCKDDDDKLIASCYGDPYNINVVPGWDCLAAK